MEAASRVCVLCTGFSAKICAEGRAIGTTPYWRRTNIDNILKNKGDKPFFLLAPFSYFKALRNFFNLRSVALSFGFIASFSAFQEAFSGLCGGVCCWSFLFFIFLGLVLQVFSKQRGAVFAYSPAFYNLHDVLPPHEELHLHAGQNYVGLGSVIPEGNELVQLIETVSNDPIPQFNPIALGGRHVTDFAVEGA